MNLLACDRCGSVRLGTRRHNLGEQPDNEAEEMERDVCPDCWEWFQGIQGEFNRTGPAVSAPAQPPSPFGFDADMIRSAEMGKNPQPPADEAKGWDETDGWQITEISRGEDFIRIEGPKERDLAWEGNNLLGDGYSTPAAIRAMFNRIVASIQARKPEPVDVDKVGANGDTVTILIADLKAVQTEMFATEDRSARWTVYNKFVNEILCDAYSRKLGDVPAQSPDVGKMVATNEPKRCSGIGCGCLSHWGNGHTCRNDECRCPNHTIELKAFLATDTSLVGKVVDPSAAPGKPIEPAPVKGEWMGWTLDDADHRFKLSYRNGRSYEAVKTNISWNSSTENLMAETIRAACLAAPDAIMVTREELTDLRDQIAGGLLRTPVTTINAILARAGKGGGE